MKSFSFYKYSGAGNDFILIDKREKGLFIPEIKDIPRICARRSGIGADGVLFFDDAETDDFNVDYFNADGSTGMLCANGARCSIYHARNSGIKKNGILKFTANGKKYSGEKLEGNQVKLNLNDPSDLKNGIEVKLNDNHIYADYLDTGSPHLVIDIDRREFSKQFGNEIEKLEVNVLGAWIRNHEMFAPKGVNVNFIKVSNEFVRVRTFERGVEGETMASGTGSTASALITALNYRFTSPVNVLTWGGEKMKIDFNFENNSFRNVSLTGPVSLVYRGEFFV